jgi:HD-like signal output (HDOD) protein
VAKVIRSDPAMAAQLIRTCNSALFSPGRRLLNIEEAVVLMGAERLRTWLLTCSVMEFTGRRLPRSKVQIFWQHSFVTGMLSERIAKWLEYSEREQAYLAGLLHDVGILPLLLVAAEENGGELETFPGFWEGSLESEKSYCGLTHCEVGGWIGKTWNFFPSFIDVFENHHHPERSMRDPNLVGIVAAADHFSESRLAGWFSEGDTADSNEVPSDDEFLASCFPRLGAEERSELTDMLEDEFLHLLPVIELNSPNVTPLRIA